MSQHDSHDNPAPQLPADDTDRPRGSYAIPVQGRGTAPPLFVLPSGMGSVAFADSLAAEIDADVPIYALPWPETLPASMESLAAQAAALIREVRPHGPYRLLGLCTGAALAYAVAQHFAHHDEPVAFVGLIDADLSANPPLDETMRTTLMAQLQATPGGPPAGQERIVHYESLRRLYMPQPLPGRLHLFESAADAPSLGLLGWERALPRERIVGHEMPGAAATRPATPREGPSQGPRPHWLETSRPIGVLGQTLRAALQAPVAAPATEPALAFPLHRGRATAPLLCCVPGAGAAVTSFLELSAALGDELDIVAMQPRGIDGVVPAFGSIELAARRYLEALRGSGTRRELHLLGHSFGGWAVFEMARQLAAAGTPAASVTILDSSAPEREPEDSDMSRGEILERFLEVVAMQVPRALPLDLGALERLDATALLEALHGLFVQVELMPRRSRPVALRGSLATFATACRTVYRPASAYTAAVNLALVDDSRLDRQTNEAEFLQCQQGWQRVAPQLRTWRGPGNHMTVLQRPHVQTLVAWWRSVALPRA